MSRQPIADAERLVRSFTHQLSQRSANLPASRLSPLEERLLFIARTFFFDCVIFARGNRIEATGEPIDRVPVSPDIVAEGSRLALAAAVEVEAPLREIREQVEVRR